MKLIRTLGLAAGVMFGASIATQPAHAQQFINVLTGGTSGSVPSADRPKFVHVRLSGSLT